MFAAELELPKTAVRTSYDVLHDVGSCSSATVLLVLDRVRKGLADGSMAIGHGLTLYTALLRASS